MSLSPRPDRLTSMIRSRDRASAPGGSACAIACALSSAGMMPSVAVSSRSASTASSSVTVTYARAPAVAQPGVLGADAGIVEPGGDRVRVADLSGLVLQQVRLVAVQHADLPGRERRRVLRPSRCRARPPRRRSAARRGRRGTRGTGRSRCCRRRRRRCRRRAAGRRACRIWRRASLPITDWKSRTISGYGCGPATEPMT